MKPLFTDHKLARRALRVLTAIGYLLTAGASLGEALSFRWRTEVSNASPYEAQAMQGESFALEATLVQYGAPLTGEATATFYYQTKQMDSTEWFTAPAAWDAATATASVTWSPALDVGQSAYRWFFGIDTAQGHNYRAYGTLRLKPSPGFSPALLEPIDLREKLKAELYAQLQAELSAAFAADLQAEAEAREAADEALQSALDAEASARAEADTDIQADLDAEAEARAARDGEITEAVNAQAGVLEQHQGYLSTLSTNYNNLASSYIQSVTDLQTKDAALESALATKAEAEHTHAIADTEGLQAALDAKAEASALSAHAATWATGSTGGHVKLGTNSILSTADGNFGVVGKTSGNQLIYRLDATPTENSGLPVKSGGVYTALAAKAALDHTHSQYLTSFTETDPTIAAWAKAATKPTYTAAEVGAQPAGKYVTYDTTSHSLDAVSKETSFAGGIRTDSFKTLYGTPFFNTVSNYGFNITGFYRLNGYLKTDKPLLEWNVSTQQSFIDVSKVYENGTLLSNKYAALDHTHSQYLTSFTETDPTIAAWAKAATKPTYTAAEVGAAEADHTHAIAEVSGLQSALDGLAPLSSVTCTTNAVTYIWQWDEEAGTFALVERE